MDHGEGWWRREDRDATHHGRHHDWQRPIGRVAVRRTDGGSSLLATTVLIAIDDTDNRQSRGTGHLAQQLVAALEGAGLGFALGVTRHQLLVDPRIPYTSHNSDAVIAWEGGATTDVEAIIAFASDFLERTSAPGSDPGLAVATEQMWSDTAQRVALIEFGRRAKAEVLDQALARGVAAACGVHLSGHGGTNDGIIGALAGVGLHLSGADGFFIWMPGLRGVEDLGGNWTYGDLLRTVPIDIARDSGGRVPAPEDLIEMGDWVRPVLLENQALLLVSALAESGADSSASPLWRVAPRAVVKSY